jgi:hypothetical protein
MMGYLIQLKSLSLELSTPNRAHSIIFVFYLKVEEKATSKRLCVFVLIKTRNMGKANQSTINSIDIEMVLK